MKTKLTGTPDLSIIVPVYNEKSTILDTLSRLKKETAHLKKCRIIVVDDGSIDGTRKMLMNSPHLYNELIINENNQGKGKSIIAALNIISSGYVLIQDADLEYDPKEIPKIWNAAIQNEADVLHTSRLNGSDLTRVHYFWHKIGNRLLTLIFNIINNTTFTDVYSGYLLFNIEKVDVKKLKVNRWGQQAELLTFLLKNSKKIYEIPISYHGRTYEDGKKIRASAMFSVVLTILITKFRVTFE